MLVWAVLQFALPGVASYADALLERASTRALGAHVEAHGSRTCPAVHPADCAICHIVHRSSAPPVACMPVGIIARMSIPHESGSPISTRWARGRVALPRAPPLA